MAMTALKNFSEHQGLLFWDWAIGPIKCKMKETLKTFSAWAIESGESINRIKEELMLFTIKR